MNKNEIFYIVTMPMQNYRSASVRIRIYSSNIEDVTSFFAEIGKFTYSKEKGLKIKKTDIKYLFNFINSKLEGLGRPPINTAYIMLN